jgi:hypothetical protein
MKVQAFIARGSLFVLGALLFGCVAGIRFTTESAGTSSVEGTYDLYLYGCRYPSDFENVAILVVSDSPYPLDIFAHATRYKIKKGLTGEKALAEANAFIRCSMKSVWNSAVRRIVDDRGKTFGYDVRPLYMPYEVGGADVMLMQYYLSGGKVTAYISVFPEVEDSGGDNDRRGGRDR